MPYVYDPNEPDNQRHFHPLKYACLWWEHGEIAADVAVNMLEAARQLLDHATPHHADRSDYGDLIRELKRDVQQSAVEARSFLNEYHEHDTNGYWDPES